MSLPDFCGVMYSSSGIAGLRSYRGDLVGFVSAVLEVMVVRVSFRSVTNAGVMLR